MKDAKLVLSNTEKVENALSSIQPEEAVRWGECCAHRAVILAEVRGETQAEIEAENAMRYAKWAEFWLKDGNEARSLLNAGLALKMAAISVVTATAFDYPSPDADYRKIVPAAMSAERGVQLKILATMLGDETPASLRTADFSGAQELYERMRRSHKLGLAGPSLRDVDLAGGGK